MCRIQQNPAEGGVKRGQRGQGRGEGGSGGAVRRPGFTSVGMRTLRAASGNNGNAET